MVAFSKEGAAGAINTVMEISKIGLEHKLSSKAINAELISTDVDGQAKLVAVDTTGDEQVDTVLKVTEDSNFTEQQLRDGQEIDVDGDGVADMVAIDTTGDGHLDTVVQLNDA